MTDALHRMDKDDMNKQLFVETLMKLAGVSEAYADSAWFSLSASGRSDPQRSAFNFYQRVFKKVEL